MPELTLVEPAFCTHPDYYATLGPEASDFAAEVGFVPDPEQRLGLDLIYAANRDGSPVAFEFAVICSRQNLKTGLFKIAALTDAFYLKVKLVTWTAHLFDTTEGAFRDLKELIDGSDLLTRRVRKITEGNGDEEIILTNGCRIQFKARLKASGRGKTGSKIFLDEGLFLQPAHIGSLYPITATLRDAQIRIGSSAGLTTSAVLRDIRDRGRKGSKGLAYLEWSDTEPPNCEDPHCTHHRDTPGCCADDRDRWRRSNPAMGRRISEDRIESFRQSMPAPEFVREFLGWWEEPEDDVDGLDFSNWPGLRDPESQPDYLPVYAIAVSPDRDWAAISVAGQRTDGLKHVDVGHHRQGTSWVVKAAAAIAEKHPDAVFVIDGGGPANSLIPKLEEAGLILDVVGAREQAAAFGLFMDGVRESTTRHRDQRELNSAITSAKKRTIGDGASAFGRKASGEDITPLESAALALLGHDKAQEGVILW